MLADALPIYPLYALLFADHGFSGGEISGLFAVWSATAILAEVPTGALADRYSRRLALVTAAILQATGYVVWITLPGVPGFAGGFVLWGLGGALASGALEALLYDGLAASGAAHQYARVYGWVSAAGLIAQVPAAIAATALFPAGGYALAGWVSVALCLCAAAVALRLPESVDRGDAPRTGDAPGYRSVLATGVREAAASPLVRTAVIAVAVVTGIDAVEEYFSLLARDWGVPTHLTPLATVAIPLVGAAGAALAGRAGRPTGGLVAAWLGAAALSLAAASTLHRAAGLSLVALFYGLYHAVSVIADARLQERIRSGSRATVASVASLATELSVFLVYAAWTVGGAFAVAVLVGLTAAVLPRLLAEPRT